MNTITFHDVQVFAQFIAELVRQGIQFQTDVDEAGNSFVVRCTGGF